MRDWSAAQRDAASPTTEDMDPAETPAANEDSGSEGAKQNDGGTQSEAGGANDAGASNDTGALTEGGSPSADAEAGQPNQELPPACQPGDVSACAEDAMGRSISGLTGAVGVCHFGTRSCQDGRWGPCMNAVGPGRRQCDSDQDNDCDGFADSDRTRRDGVCACWATEQKACTGAAPSNCPGVMRCVEHQWAACDAPTQCACTGSETRACVGGANQCPGGTQKCVDRTWQGCENAPEQCECEAGAARACSGGPNRCAGGTQRCVNGAWGACENAPEFCECGANETKTCASVPGAPICGNVSCGGGRWDLSKCLVANACGSCGSLAQSPGSACDGSDTDRCADGVWQCSAGQLVCSDQPGGVGGLEVCDGADNDCDGNADNASGMECARAQNATCTFASGMCTAPGKRLCSDQCRWGACEALPEAACDRVDDDCDGVADDALLKVGNPIQLASFDGEIEDMDLAVSPASSAAAGGYLVVYNTLHRDQSDSYKLRMLRISASGALLGTATTLTTSPSWIGRPAVAWVGSGWLVGYSKMNAANNGSDVWTVTVNPSTGALGTPAALASGPNVWIQGIIGGRLPVVYWTEDRTVSGSEVHAATLGATTVKRKLLGIPKSGSLITAYDLPRATLIEDGTQWGMWTRKGVHQDGAHTYETRFVTFDSGLNVQRDQIIHSGDDLTTRPRQLIYEPKNQRLVGFTGFFGSGEKQISHARDGAAVRSKDSYHELLAADGDGTYSSFWDPGVWNRYNATDTEVESLQQAGFARFSGQDTEMAVVATGAHATNRFTVVGGLDGMLRILFLGCK